MRIEALASSSSGNCYVVSDGNTRILLECGITWKGIQRKLNFKMSDINYCLISHSHADHSRAAKDVAKAGIDIFTSIETLQELGLAKHHRAHSVKSLTQFEIGTFTVLPFELQHDVFIYGYLISSSVTNQKFLFITDTFYCKYKFQGLDIIAIECNYSKAIVDENLKNGIIEKAQVRRLYKSHFSLERVKEFLAANDLAEVRKIYLTHLSNRNSNAELFKTEIERLTGIPTEVC